MRFGLLAAPLALSTLAGCASGPVFTEAAPPGSDKALVYIYREADFVAAASGAAFYVDEQKVADLMAGGYTFVYLAPGHYEVEQRWSLFNYAPQGGDSVSTQLDVRAGDVRYVRFRSGTTGAACYNCMGFGWQIAQVPPQVGRAEIAKEKLTVPDVRSIGP
ncbi:MAG TPA: DUF2846 domain-containing protein [Rhizomicrobium sp.]|nr:DUF2846 domain-containing protein [Rhizomicrobium sp.]